MFWSLEGDEHKWTNVKDIAGIVAPLGYTRTENRTYLDLIRSKREHSKLGEDRAVSFLVNLERFLIKASHHDFF